MDGFRFVRLLLPLAGAAALWVAAASFATPPKPALGSAAAASRAGVDREAREPRTTTARRKRRRPGCGRFCRQAGGFGAGPEEGEGPVFMASQRVRADRDWIIAVRAICRRSKACVGAILVDSRSVSYGRADLRIPAHATRRVEVGVPARARRYLRSHHRDRHAFATVALTNHTVSISRTLTIIAPR